VLLCVDWAGLTAIESKCLCQKRVTSPSLPAVEMPHIIALFVSIIALINASSSSGLMAIPLTLTLLCRCLTILSSMLECVAAFRTTWHCSAMRPISFLMARCRAAPVAGLV